MRLFRVQFVNSGVVDRTESDKRLRICLRRELHYAAVTQADAFIARMNVAHSASCDNTSQNDCLTIRSPPLIGKETIRTPQRW